LGAECHAEIPVDDVVREIERMQDDPFFRDAEECVRAVMADFVNGDAEQLGKERSPHKKSHAPEQ
jgi:hypothetical protein